MTTNSLNILVIKLGALGDFIQALGPMAAIRAHHPDAQITLLTTKPYAAFGQACGYFNDVWIDEKPGLLNLEAWLRLRKKLNEAAFTRVYDLQNNDRTSLYLRLFHGAKKPEWVGAAKGASHRNASPQRIAGHAFEGHAQTLALAGIHNVRIDRLEWIKDDVSSFALQKPYILIIPGSAPTRTEKRWPAASYGRLCETLASWGYQPVLIGSRHETDIMQQIVKTCPKALDLSQQTSLTQLVCLAREASAAIGNDTGPLHLIAATGCPCVALFSKASDPLRHAPMGESVRILQDAKLEDLQPEHIIQALQPRFEPPRKSSMLH